MCQNDTAYGSQLNTVKNLLKITQKEWREMK